MKHKQQRMNFYYKESLEKAWVALPGANQSGRNYRRKRMEKLSTKSPGLPTHNTQITKSFPAFTTSPVPLQTVPTKAELEGALGTMIPVPNLNIVDYRYEN